MFHYFSLLSSNLQRSSHCSLDYILYAFSSTRAASDQRPCLTKSQNNLQYFGRMAFFNSLFFLAFVCFSIFLVILVAAYTVIISLCQVKLTQVKCYLCVDKEVY